MSLQVACNPANTPHRTRTIPPGTQTQFTIAQTHLTIRGYLLTFVVCKRVSTIAARPSSRWISARERIEMNHSWSKFGVVYYL